MENLIDLGHLDVLDDHLAVSLSILLVHHPIGLRHLPSLTLVRVRVENIAVQNVTLADLNHFFELGDAVKHEEPALSEVVALESGQFEDLPYD